MEQQCSTWYWQAWRQGSAFRQQSFYFRYYVEKGKKEKFIQLGIWPEMKLVTANELAKSMVPGLLKEKSPSKSLSNSAAEQHIMQIHRSQDRLKNWCMVTLIR